MRAVYVIRPAQLTRSLTHYSLGQCIEADKLGKRRLQTAVFVFSSSARRLCRCAQRAGLAAPMTLDIHSNTPTASEPLLGKKKQLTQTHNRVTRYCCHPHACSLDEQGTQVPQRGAIALGS